MTLLKYFFGMVFIGLIAAFAFFAIIDVPVKTQSIQVSVSSESLNDGS